VLPDVTDAQVLYSQSTFARQAVKAQTRVEFLAKPQQAIDGLASAWPPIVRLWKQIGALEETAGLLASKRSSPKQLSGLIDQLEQDFSKVIDVNASIKYLTHVSVHRQRVEALDSQLTQVETELEAARAEAAKGLCGKCGKPLEHICG
jgi:hypothetical protein